MNKQKKGFLKGCKKNLVGRKKVWFFLKIFLPLTILLSLFSSLFFSGTRYQPSFYNFESYINPKNERNFSKKYSYKLFSGSDELKPLLANNKAIGGITSDFEIVPLIKLGLVKPINYSVIYGKDFPKDSSIEVQEDFLKKRWRTGVWDHVKSFDSYLDSGKHLWQYALPYYVQDRVIVYNVDKISRKNLSKKLTDREVKEGIDFGSDLSTFNILRTLRDKGYQKFAWIDSIRDNALLGIYYKNYKAKGIKGGFQWLPTAINSKNFSSSIDGFIELVRDSTGKSLFDTKTNVLISDGLEVVKRLLDPSGDLDVALVYNGDALDAYYYEDNFPQLEERGDYPRIRFVRPVDNMILLDAVVISSNLTDSESNTLLENLRETVYSGFELKTRVDIENGLKTRLNLKQNSQLSSSDIYSNELILPWARNFDYINYTPIQKSWYDFFLKHYFAEDEEVEARTIYKMFTSEDSNKRFSKISVLDEQLTSALNIYYYLRTHT